ncbi:Dol-P-Glc:Glc(2)Man(9)GlcNAc(2)-PP-Dol alpha-1,2-glucosyltransferase [Hypsibius exemplaris]|uniref:Dol-P-Glc:Glc(2)Man(9)GlcNAc(2)-PP-Dol alpha-1,2-glucosyltransferase n=1 Tax=Hypsibius exemplaris TaxID=2072580 RepID=A0A1W0WMQ3_HYPEX|nr:Dol-P-Glc:Glc(2)Man(9)GlcNAc(2)-PP-Dol alpha-1,2-glucosyltransferase [Hypsibius exemplaris]
MSSPAVARKPRNVEESPSKTETPPMRGPMTTIGVLFALLTLHIFTLISSDLIPGPYMDEIFHIKQARTYCGGNFTEWDPKLTTLPGLYFVSLAEWKFLSLFVTLKDPCSVWNLRLTNFFFAVAGIFLFHRILLIIHPHYTNSSKFQLYTSAINLSTFPLLYFFTFLYYTDQASTFFTLAMLYFHISGSRGLAALIGAVAVFTRQTNIVWVGSLAALELFKSYRLIMQTVARTEDLKKITDDKDLQVLLSPFLSLLRNPTKSNLRRVAGFFLGVLVEGVPRILGYLTVMAGFLAFLIHNKGIVVGDRSAHQASLHIPQLFYFTAFTLFFASPYLITPTKVKAFFFDCLHRPVRVVIAVGAITAAIANFTYAHPYLLADNRHYTFYIWNRLFQRHHLVKYALTPVYLYGFWAMWDELRQRGVLRMLLFFAACCAVLVPQQLLEFRYFILPYLLFRIQLQKPSASQVVMEFLLYQAVNAVTLWLFLYKPFKTPGTGELQHFMW